MVFKDHALAQLSVKVRSSLKIATGFYEQCQNEPNKTASVLRLMRDHNAKAIEAMLKLAENAKERDLTNELTNEERDEVFALADKVKKATDDIKALLGSELNDIPTSVV